MKMTFRWYGLNDRVKLDYIKQIPGMTGVVTALYSVPVGEVWPEEEFKSLKAEVEKHNLECEVIESVPVSEDIKLGRGDYKRRSQLDHKLPDGSEALVYYEEDVAKLDPTKLSLPGWDSSYKPEEVKELIKAYQELGEEGLWHNLEVFLKEIIPVAKESGILMAIHPDDPAWPIFGIPRIITTEANIDRFLKLVDEKENGLTLCSGSLGTRKENDMVKLVKKYVAMDRIHFAHIRNIKLVGDHSFEESAHYSKCGSLDMVGMVGCTDCRCRKSAQTDILQTIYPRI